MKSRPRAGPSMLLNDKVPEYWFQIAAHDCDAVKVLIAAKSHPDIIIYHLHQSIEKILKGKILETSQEFPFIHDLKRLFTILSEKKPELGHLTDAIIGLQSFQRNLRYPQSEFLEQADLQKALDYYNTIVRVLAPELIV